MSVAGGVPLGNDMFTQVTLRGREAGQTVIPIFDNLAKMVSSNLQKYID